MAHEVLNGGALEYVGGPAGRLRGTRVRGRDRKHQVMRGREGGGEGGDGGSGWVRGWAGILHVWESSATAREGGRDGGVSASEAYNMVELLLQFTPSLIELLLMTGIVW